jgi:hypothetical protein
MKDIIGLTVLACAGGYFLWLVFATILAIVSDIRVAKAISARKARLATPAPQDTKGAES